MEKREGIHYIIEQNRLREVEDMGDHRYSSWCTFLNRLREVEDMGDLATSYSGWNADGIRYIHDSELNSILPAVRILMPELTKKNDSWLLITGVREVDRGGEG